MRTLKLFLLCLITAAVCQTARAGMAVRLWYTAPGTSVTNITVLPGFPNGSGFNPSIYYAYDDVIGNLDTALTYLTTSLRDDTSYLNNYGTYIRGWIEAPADGSYRFFIYSDDNSEVWLSSNESPANRSKIAENIGAVGRGNYSAKAAQRSASIPLQKGKKYYYEVFTKEGGGDDHFGVGWQLPDGTLNRPISGKYLLPFNQVFSGWTGESNNILTVGAPTFSIPRYTGFNSAPTFGNVSGHPVSQQGTENGDITFEGTVIGAQPMTMQWFIATNNGTFVAIPGANLQHITVSNLTIAANNNTQYQLRVTNANGNATSSAATLTVVADTTKPTLVSVDTYGRENGLTVVFSEPVNATALATNNYIITNTVTFQSFKVLSASFWGSSNRTVNLVTEQFPVVASTYDLIVSGVQDRAAVPNAILPGSSLSFNSVYQDNRVTLRYFQNITTGGTVANLTNASTFINNLPDIVETRSLFEGPTTFADNYGIQYLAYVVPPVTGDYTFYVSSDDQSILWLSTDMNPANKKAIAAEPNNSGVRVWFNGGAPRYDGSGNAAGITTAFGITSPMNVSKPVTLQANTRYYIEYLTKEGGGGDNGAVAWQIPGGAVVANNSTPIEAAYLTTTNQGGIAITITQQPTNSTFSDQQNATFRVVATGSAPAYQWYRGNLSSNSPIPDATGATLTTDPVGFQDQGAQFFVIVNNGFSAATSSVATLTVIADTVKPTLVRALSDAEFDLVTLSFSERVNEGTATNAANYTISGGLNVTAARLGQGRTNVVLNISPLMNTGTVYTVTVSGVMDSSSSSNAIVAGSTIQFTSWVETRGFALVQTYLNIGGTAITDLTGQSAFPDLPDSFTYITGGLNFPQTSPDLNNYGVRITGTITPATFDFYKFLITSDDASVMYLGTDNRQSSVVRANPVAEQTGANVAFSAMPGTFSDQVMFAGVPRAYEVLMKEGGGGDFVRAAWVGGLADPTTYNNNALIDALPAIPAVYLSVYANPVGANIGIVTQPIAAITTNEVFQLNLSLVATGSISGVANPPISYIWQRKRTSDADFVDFVDNNGNASFLTPRLQYPADNGARYRALVSVPGKTIISSETVVTVGQDTTAPVIVRSYGSANFTNVTIAFNEPIDISQLTGLSITSTNGALTVSNPRIVQLTNLVLDTSLQTTNVRYTVTLSGVRDIAFAPTTIAPNTTTSFTSWIIGRGGVTAQRFLNLGTATAAGGLDVLRNAAKFPNNPDQQWMMNESRIPQSGGADLRTEGASPGLDGFGGRMYGYIIPPTNGNYVFYIQSDDSSELRLSTNSDPAGMTLIMGDRASCCQAPSDTFANIYPVTATSARVVRWTNSLAANTLYYFEAIYKEGGGGDLLRLVWKDANNTAAPNATGYIPANNLASIINPDDSSITFTPNLSDVSVLENRNVTFNGTAIAKSFFTLPGLTTSDAVTYQWQTDGGTGFTNISGQTGATLTRLLNTTHQGHKFRVIASVTIPIAMTATSAVSTVTIGIDTARPILQAIGRNPYFTNLVLTFDELLAPASVTNVLNYSITNAAGVSIPVNRAYLSRGSNVILETGLQSTGATYTLSISPTNVISDLSLAGTNIFTGGTSRTYNTFVLADGYLRVEYFTDTTINNVGSLTSFTNSAGFRSNITDIVRYTNFAHIAQTAPDLNNFGSKLFGFFKAPTNGAYTFFCRGDDGNALMMTTNGVRQAVAARDGTSGQSYDSSNPLNNNTPASAKVVLNLTAGEYYQFEGLVREGGGGDFLEIAVTANGQATPATGGAGTIPTQFLATYADPDLSTLNITGQPANLTRAVGATATFSVTATGTSGLPGATIRYQWTSNGVNIVNATNASHTTPALTLGANGAVYQVRVYHPEKALLSSAATLTVGTAPAITAQITPSAVVTNVGSNVTFTVTATGSPTPSYQWRLNSNNIAGANLTLLTLNNVQFTNQGSYTVVISNALGSVTSSPASLQVLVTPYSVAGSSRTGSVYRSTFPTDAGRTYVVEYANALSNNNATVWTVLTNVVGNGSPAGIADPGASGSERYYRIRTLFP